MLTPVGTAMLFRAFPLRACSRLGDYYLPDHRGTGQWADRRRISGGVSRLAFDLFDQRSDWSHCAWSSRDCSSKSIVEPVYWPA